MMNYGKKKEEEKMFEYNEEDGSLNGRVSIVLSDFIVVEVFFVFFFTKK